VTKQLSDALPLSPPCRCMRFDGLELDSAVSCSIACKSSVAEITGNSRIRMQARLRT
jgi:hypothetical protein